MGVTTVDDKKYGKLLAKTRPKVIETEGEFDRMVALLEDLSIPERDLTPEEEILASLLEKLIADYDDKVELPEVPPHEMVRYLMEQRGLKQADLVPVIGSRAQVSDLVNGNRGISKAQAKRLAEFFGISVELFI
ncbi:MAG: helix-turn-helix domain-containing protein [Acidobacteriia bacterium]|nr:helix-turn-helix domain-containing protein [Terriglobia bacterium]